MIFETERLIVRKLILDDLNPFHQMQSNPLVMQYTSGDVKSMEAHREELQELIEKYDISNNDFWIYAIENKSSFEFIGTVALVKDGEDDEIGYRLLEKHWGNGFGYEVSKGLINYCKTIGFEKLIAYVVDKNSASKRILEKLNFQFVSEKILEEEQLLEIKYKLHI